MLDPIVQRLVEQAIDTPVKLHLLLMFHENPRMEATPAAIADRVCRDIWSVGQALQELCDDGIMLRSATANGEPVYRYRPKDELVTAIEHLMRGYDDPLERDQLQRLIRDLADYAAYRRANIWDVNVA